MLDISLFGYKSWEELWTEISYKWTGMVKRETFGCVLLIEGLYSWL